MMKPTQAAATLILAVCGAPSLAQDISQQSRTAQAAASRGIFLPIEPIEKEFWVSGGALYAMCKTDVETNEGLSDYSLCAGYVKGALDGFLTQQANTGKRACMTEGLTVGQLIDNVVAYIERNPDMRQKPADFSVGNALTPHLRSCS